MLKDILYAGRLLRRTPLLTFTLVVSLAIGIGANAAVFTVAGALLFNPPAGVADAGRLVDIGRSQDGRGFDTSSYPNFLDVRARSTVAEEVYAYRFGAEPLSLGGSGGAERIFGVLATTNYFTALGVRPLIGRFFAPDDSERPGSAPITVLSHAFWTRRFEGDPAVVGRTITLNGHPFTIVGIAPERFHGTTVLATDVWVPLTMAAELTPRRTSSILTSRESTWLVMGARLKPHVSLAAARAEFSAIGRALEREFPLENRGKGLAVTAQSPVPGNAAPVAAFFALLMAIVATVLAIACINVAGVLLVRGAMRRREIAVRVAIGAGRASLIRPMIVEAAWLCLAGGALGLVLARALTRLLLLLVPTLPVPVDVSLPLDARIVAFTLAVSFVAAVAAGLAPALQAARVDPIAGLKANQLAGLNRHRWRNGLVVAQVALSTLLVVVGALLGRALVAAGRIDAGFVTHGLELASLDFSLGGYTEQTGPTIATSVIDRIRGTADVESAALCAIVPLGGSSLGMGDLLLPGSDAVLAADWNVVTPGYFSTLHVPLLAGRDFSTADRAGTADVVIVNETAARRWWSHQDPLGRVIVQRTGRRPDQIRRLTVVGVARDMKYRSLGEDPTAFVFVPVAQQYLSRLTLVARAASGRRLASDLRAGIRALDPNLPIVTAQTFDDYASLALVPQRVAATLAGGLGAVGVLLAAIGVYGLTAYVVTARTREIGVRVALGARRFDVLRLVLGQGAVLTASGVAVGVVLAALAGTAIRPLLFGVAATDAAALGGTAAFVTVVAVAASFAPARRAAAMDPMAALRDQ